MLIANIFLSFNVLTYFIPKGSKLVEKYNRRKENLIISINNVFQRSVMDLNFC
jgi:hypothetical protein